MTLPTVNAGNLFKIKFTLFQLYLYNKETKKVTYSEFINRELILFSNMDVERSIPSMVDGKYFNVTQYYSILLNIT